MGILHVKWLSLATIVAWYFVMQWRVHRSTVKLAERTKAIKWNEVMEAAATIVALEHPLKWLEPFCSPPPKRSYHQD
jgi:hypothetical protein